MLTSYWNEKVGSHATVWESDSAALGKGWLLLRRESQAQRQPFVELGVTRTTPLQLYRHSKSGRCRTVATTESIAEATRDDFRPVIIVAHVWLEPPRYLAAISLRQYVHPLNGDHFLVGDAVSEHEALAGGYKFQRVEGFTFGGGTRLSRGSTRIFHRELPLELTPDFLRFPWVRRPPLSTQPTTTLSIRDADLPQLSWGRMLWGDPAHDGFETLASGTNFDLSQDRILLTVEPGDAGFVEFVLESGPQVTWWKSIALAPRFSPSSSSPIRVTPLVEAPIEGANQRASIRRPIADVVGQSLWFSKAKRLGVRSTVYELGDLTAMAGRRVVFRWLRDNEGKDERAPLGWQSFRERLVQGDLIQVTLGGGSRGVATFVLANTRRTTWWKQIRLLRQDRSHGPAVSIEGRDAAPVVLRVPIDELPHARLLFSKAMSLGFHTDIYELNQSSRDWHTGKKPGHEMTRTDTKVSWHVLRVVSCGFVVDGFLCPNVMSFDLGDLTIAGGRTVTFNWLRDDLPDPYKAEWRAGFRLLEEHWVIRRWPRSSFCDGDIIVPMIEPLGPGRERDVELVLQLDGGVTWWKALKLFNIFDLPITEVSAEGVGARSAPITGRFDELWWCNLVFAKAKFLGRHEDKYEYQLSPFNLHLIGASPGTRVVFVWSRDNLPRLRAGCDA